MSIEEQRRQPPSLVELCITTAIDNVRFIGYVGGIDFQLLDQILQHCTIEQLMHVEDCTGDTDLSPVTNKLWKRFYEKQFGHEKMNIVIERMKRNKVTFKWRHLYEAKLKDVEQDEERAADRLKQLYEKEDAKKQNRKTKLCAKVPPNNKRGFWANGPGYNLSNVKSNIMKKAKLDLLKSQEIKNLAAMKRNAVQKSFSINAPKRSILPPSTSRSTSLNTPPKRSSLSASTSVSTTFSTPLKRGNLSTSISGSTTFSTPPKKSSLSASTSGSTGFSILPKKNSFSASTSGSTAFITPPKRNSLSANAAANSRNTPTDRR